MRIIKILSLICFLTISLFAQKGAVIEGQVLINGEPAKGVEVRFYTKGFNKIRTETDENGNFRFENVPAGNINLVAEDFEIHNAGK